MAQGSRPAHPSLIKTDRVAVSAVSDLSGSSDEDPGGARVAAAAAHSFPIDRARFRDRFRRQFYRDVPSGTWSDWRWQFQHRIRTLDELSRFFPLSLSETRAQVAGSAQLPLAVTPYYLSLVDPFDPSDPIRRSIVPTAAERLVGPEEATDPLGEDHHSPVPGLVHRYPDRVLFLATSVCATYCRYCTRSRLVGQGGQEDWANKTLWGERLAYIAAHREVRDVVISGGDPLTLGDEALRWLLGEFRRIPHVEIVRIGTKVPMVMPQRISRELVRMMRGYHPLWLSIHCTHPRELTSESKRALGRLADAGIPLGSQTVLLKGINDQAETLKALFQGLLKCRVRPYYLYQCDPINGSKHFRTPVERGSEIIGQLRGHTSGYAVPTFVIDAPGGGGKIALSPNTVIGRDGGDLVLHNYRGDTYRYPDPISDSTDAGRATLSIAPSP